MEMPGIWWDWNGMNSSSWARESWSSEFSELAVLMAASLASRFSKILKFC